MATEKLKTFLGTEKIAVDDSVDTVPGIGDVNVAKLAARDITKVGQLLGLFMTCNLDKEAFVGDLVETTDMASQWAVQAADALYAKAQEFCTTKPPDQKEAAGGQTASGATFMGNKLSTVEIMPGYVPGLGHVSCTKLISKGVKSTVQLMGEFLLKNRSRTDFVRLLVESADLNPSVLKTKGKETDLFMLEKTKMFCR